MVSQPLLVLKSAHNGHIQISFIELKKILLLLNRTFQQPFYHRSLFAVPLPDFFARSLVSWIIKVHRTILLHLDRSNTLVVTLSPQDKYTYS